MIHSIFAVNRFECLLFVKWRSFRMLKTCTEAIVWCICIWVCASCTVSLNIVIKKTQVMSIKIDCSNFMLLLFDLICTHKKSCIHAACLYRACNDRFDRNASNNTIHFETNMGAKKKRLHYTHIHIKMLMIATHSHNYSRKSFSHLKIDMSDFSDNKVLCVSFWVILWVRNTILKYKNNNEARIWNNYYTFSCRFWNF